MTRLSLAVALVLALVLPAVAADHPLLVTPAWVAERLGRADVRIIDLSDAEDYARGHIPGAVHLDFTDTRPQASEGVFRAPTAEVASFVISWRRPRPPGAGGPSCDWRDRSAARAISRHGRAFRTREGHRRHGLSRGIREP